LSLIKILHIYLENVPWSFSLFLWGIHFVDVTRVKKFIELAPGGVERIIKGAALQTIEGC
jgi:hypothetical protein